MKAALRTVTIVSFFLLTVSGIHVPRAHAGDPCGELSEDCCDTGPECDSADLTCEGGQCVSCGGQDEPCCAAQMCDPGLSCESTPGDTLNSESPEGGGAGSGSETCIACGDAGEPCCGGTDCNAGSLCLTGICESCGGDNEPCCDLGGCDSGFVCEPVCDLWTTDGQGGGAISSPCMTINPTNEEGSGAGAQVTQIQLQPGVCHACGGDGEPCCETGGCDSGFVCEPVCDLWTLDGQGGGAAGTPCGNTEQIEAEGGELRPTVCQPCGGAAEPCCDEMSCNEGFTCMMGYTETADQGGAAEGLLNGSCFPCGALGEPCCDDSMCSGDNLLCGGEFCEACGAIGEQCCANNTCPNAAAICLQGTCEALPAAPAMGTWGLAALLLMLTGIGAFRLRRG